MDRTGYLGGSDAMALVNGDWLELYNETIGITPPDDLSGVFRVQLGKHTEGFHIRWLIDQQERQEIVPIPETQLKHKQYDWMRFRPDALVDGGSFLECKHTNAFNNYADLVARYMPQLAHGCLVMKTDWCLFSIICGNSDPDCRKITIPKQYQVDLLELEKSFWWHVENNEPPLPSGYDMDLDGAGVLIDDMKVEDMTGNNEWAMLAGNIIETKDARDRHEHCKNEIKAMIKPDVGEAYGHGIVFKRSKNGSLRMSFRKEKT